MGLRQGLLYLYALKAVRVMTNMKKGIKLNELPMSIRKKIINENNITLPVANLESSIGNELERKKKGKELDRRCSIHVHSKRYREADPDGISFKAVIDGLVKAGILKDDNSKYVKEVSGSQEKISKNEQEETIIDIYET